MQWRKWDGTALRGVWNESGLVEQELYDHSAHAGWPADAPGCFDFEQVNLAVGASKATHREIIANLSLQLASHYSSRTDL